MKKIICVLIMLTIMGTSAFPQLLNADKKIAELKASGVDTLITFSPQSTWHHYDLSKKGTCQSFYQKYLIWFKDGRNYIQLFDECYTYNVIADTVSDLFSLVKGHIPEIVKEKIKPVEYKVIYNGKETLATTVETDQLQWIIVFYIRSEVIKKSIDSYDLGTEYVKSPLLGKTDSGYNVNYNYNQNTYLNRIKNVLDKKVKELQFQKL